MLVVLSIKHIRYIYTLRLIPRIVLPPTPSPIALSNLRTALKGAGWMDGAMNNFTNTETI